jgi:predicted Rossmann fold flavoprotein
LIQGSTQPSGSASLDVIVLGAGAAGLFCAILAGRRQRRVLLIDHADKAGKKILISGGGRCNFTNIHTRPENFLSANPHFCRSALARFTPVDFIALVQQHNIPYHEKTLGQLFCDRSSQDIVSMLQREAAAAGVRVLLGTRVSSVTATPPPVANVNPAPRFRIETSSGIFHANSIVIATGALSIPKMGATGLGYQIAEQFGLNIVPTRPGLVPLVFSPEDQQSWCDLTGLSAETVACATAKEGKGGKRVPIPCFREKFLITHRGLSGPAILQASSYWLPGGSIRLDLAPGHDITPPLLTPNARRDSGAALNALRGVLPARMAERWLALYPPPNWTNAGLAAFEAQLHAWTVIPAGTEGYAKAEVTAGGVDTAELDSQTMESKKIPGLYFIGEVVDVTGWLGGYNLQWAWASAHAAALAV